MAHTCASNVEPSSETQSYFFWWEFAKPRIFCMSLGFKNCKITIQVLPIAVLGLADFY